MQRLKEGTQKLIALSLSPKFSVKTTVNSKVLKFLLKKKSILKALQYD